MVQTEADFTKYLYLICTVTISSDLNIHRVLCWAVDDSITFSHTPSVGPLFIFQWENLSLMLILAHKGVDIIYFMSQ